VICDPSSHGSLVGPEREQHHIGTRSRDLLGASDLVTRTAQGFVEMNELYVMARGVQLCRENGRALAHAQRAAPIDPGELNAQCP
jgi:hypothetical protein